MNIEHLQSIIRARDKTELVRRLAADLDRPSPLIGADGPPDQPGPEEPYIRALAEPSVPDLAPRLADALQVLLLDEAWQIAKTGRVPRPLLLYNVFSLLEAVRLPGVEELLQILDTYPDFNWALTAGELPSRKHLMSDADLASVRNDPWFAELLASAQAGAD